MKDELHEVPCLIERHALLGVSPSVLEPPGAHAKLLRRAGSAAGGHRAQRRVPLPSAGLRWLRAPKDVSSN